MRRCPNCWRDEDVARAHFRWLDLLFVPLLLSPYRCCSCNVRFYRPFWGRRPKES